MAVSIESAYLGDEKSRVNVTESIRKKITSSGIEVPVDSSLIPIIQLEGEIKLSNDEITEAKQKAETVCGSGNDRTCIEMKTQEFTRQRLAEKENEKVSTANIIKGRRLTVTVKDGGKKRVLEVPEGQVFKLTKEELGSKKLEDSIAQQFNITGPLLDLLKAVLVIVSTGLYAFSILITYKTFLEAGYLWQTYAATAASVFFPYSGFLIIFGWFAIREIIKNMPVKKQ